ncbi:MAG: homocysteine S-methyltransferase family protein [Candidatus Omnitrophica bacterium]|nr:homocysteine S-methyltransferase family protein [Candidatus Omnitrophota bacterium]
MGNKNDLNSLIRQRAVVLDGAIGTELQKKGLASGDCPELWCLKNPEIIKGIHSEYRKAGADIVYTCTFGANPYKLGQFGIKEVRKVNRELANLAKNAVDKKAFVAGDIGPTGHFVWPFGAIGFEEAVSAYKEQARGLLEGGVDLFVIETMMDIQEARAALIAVKELCDKFVIVTMTFEKTGRTLNGTDPVSALITLQSLGADAVGCNCSTGPEDMSRFISLMKPYSKVPLVAKPNAGMPKLVADRASYDMNAKKFASFGKGLVSSGANFLGGCCGTTPAHILELKKAVKDKKPVANLLKPVSALSSARKTVLIEDNKPLLMIGERINPTGKKDLQNELLGGKFSLVRKMAKDQESEGASVLDLNVGAHGIDEGKTIKEAIGLLATITDLPLCIDSSNLKAIEGALRVYPGRALINSISAEKNSLKKLLPLAAKYGAMFILLPVTEKGVAKTAGERKAVVEGVFKKAAAFGFTKADMLVDCLALSVSSQPDAAIEALKTIDWCAGEFKSKTVLGLSNISFGLPQRKWVNAAFLAMANARGLTAAILNPGSPELQSVLSASDFLTGKRRDGLIKAPSLEIQGQILHPLMKAVVEGNKEEIVVFVKDALKSGYTALKIINEIMIPAITKTGELFEKKEFYLPQLIASAEASKKAFAYLEPHLKKDNQSAPKKGVIILSTVKGDIHDIGKNIVSLMLKNHGFQVIDLGKDVSAKRIILAARLHNADIVGLSALMTTTMVNMKEVVKLARKEGLSCKFIVGGAVLTESFARSLGAEYGKDGVEAVRVATRLISP